KVAGGGCFADARWGTPPLAASRARRGAVAACWGSYGVHCAESLATALPWGRADGLSVVAALLLVHVAVRSHLSSRARSLPHPVPWLLPSGSAGHAHWVAPAAGCG